jgi:hypothetical protein
MSYQAGKRPSVEIGDNEKDDGRPSGCLLETVDLIHTRKKYVKTFKAQRAMQVLDE